MLWTAISGSWRLIDARVENDVRQEVTEIIKCGDGIVTGGARGVDSIATEAALGLDPSARQIKIILPTPLDTYIRHYFNRAAEGVIKQEQAEKLSAQLLQVKAANPAAIVEIDFSVCTQETYYARNTEVVKAADALLSFQVNGSAGTQDTIDKALQRGMTVKQRKYDL